MIGLSADLLMIKERETNLRRRTFDRTRPRCSRPSFREAALRASKVDGIGSMQKNCALRCKVEASATRHSGELGLACPQAPR